MQTTARNEQRSKQGRGDNIITFADLKDASATPPIDRRPPRFREERRIDCLGMPIKFLNMPNFERLHELLTYNPEAGELRWRFRRPGTRSGDAAGHVRTNKYGRKDHMITIDGKRYFSSRIIWMMYFREDPGCLTIDHLDRNPLNNRITNLRLADIHEQNLNTKCTSASTATRYIGVGMDSRKNDCRRPRWYGKIRVGGKNYPFGSAAVSTINNEPPSWLIDRAARLYALRDDPSITDDTLIDLIKGLKRVPGRV